MPAGLLPLFALSFQLYARVPACLHPSTPERNAIFRAQTPQLMHAGTSSLQAVLSLRGGLIGAMTPLGVFSSVYSSALITHPVLTKSVTSSVTFALSDLSAQKIQADSSGLDVKRTVTTALIGLLYFGPVLHYYLAWITALIPGSGLGPTLLKTVMGQLGFGPAMTSVFFGAFLISDKGLLQGLRQWPSKVKQDLLKV